MRHTKAVFLPVIVQQYKPLPDTMECRHGAKKKPDVRNRKMEHSSIGLYTVICIYWLWFGYREYCWQLNIYHCQQCYNRWYFWRTENIHGNNFPTNVKSNCILWSPFTTQISSTLGKMVVTKMKRWENDKIVTFGTRCTQNIHEKSWK